MTLRANTIRRMALVLMGLTFSVIAVAAIFFPMQTARIYGYTLLGVDGLNEFRAVYVGFWVGLGILLFTSAKRLDQVLLGDLAAVLVLMQALGRLFSFIFDGIPSWLFITFFFAETAVSLVALLSRPRVRETAFG